MPFQDVDEVTTEVTRAPSRVEKVLRKIFVEDWSLKLLSLAITLVLWLVVTGQNEPVTTHVSVQLNFIRPQALEISNDPPRSVDVTLTGSRSKLDNLSALDLVATIDLSDQHAGERLFRLSDKAQLSVPQGVRIDGYLPNAIPIRLESIIEKELPVDVKWAGRPAEGFEVYSVTPSQSTVTVRGPASRVNSLEKGTTETVWLNGQKESFKATNVTVDISDPKVDLVDGAVDLQFDITERLSEKTFSGIPVSGPDGVRFGPRTAKVSVEGPAQLLDSLKSGDIKVILNNQLEPNLDLRPELKGKLKLKTIVPSTFVRST